MQVVGQAELLPCVFARRLWSGRLRGRLVMHFIDNDAARFSLIKGTSPTQDSAWLTGEFWRREAKAQAFSWFEGIPALRTWRAALRDCRQSPSWALTNSAVVHRVIPEEWKMS